jgi:hypothetical protein
MVQLLCMRWGIILEYEEEIHLDVIIEDVYILGD